MLAINYSTLRNSMKKYFDIITDSIETIVVTRKSGNNLIENSYLTQNKRNYDWLMESKSQLESGKTISKDIKDLEL